MQEKDTTNRARLSDFERVPDDKRILALDLGTKKIGVAVSDESQIVVRRLPLVERRGWKELLKKIVLLIEQYDAAALVVGLPYNFDGSESEMSVEARRLARNFSLSLAIPVFLQDERLTSRSAQENLYEQGFDDREIRAQLDSEAAAIILDDFLALKAEIKARNKSAATESDE